MKEKLVAVVGASEAEPIVTTLALELGRGLADMGITVVTGGRGGVMEAASKGAFEKGGMTVGILPGPDDSKANGFVRLSIPTGLGPARNGLIVNAGLCVVAVGGGYGTLSEIALALKAGKQVIGLATWKIPGVHEVEDVQSALSAVAEEIARQEELRHDSTP